MRTRKPQTEYIASPPDSVGDHPALNFINTLHMVGGELTDAWQSDEDVAAWIVREGLRDTLPSTTWPGGALLGTARNLREIARKDAVSDPLAREKYHHFLLIQRQGGRDF